MMSLEVSILVKASTVAVATASLGRLKRTRQKQQGQAARCQSNYLHHLTYLLLVPAGSIQTL
jgi:hypothetical protein